jgi:hypothetical protein
MVGVPMDADKAVGSLIEIGPAVAIQLLSSVIVTE